eukprot:2792756-Amphidinium_carterae.1
MSAHLQHQAAKAPTAQSRVPVLRASFEAHCLDCKLHSVEFGQVVAAKRVDLGSVQQLMHH